MEQPGGEQAKPAQPGPSTSHTGEGLCAESSESSESSEQTDSKQQKEQEQDNAKDGGEVDGAGGSKDDGATGAGVIKSSEKEVKLKASSESELEKTLAVPNGMSPPKPNPIHVENETEKVEKPHFVFELSEDEKASLDHLKKLINELEISDETKWLKAAEEFELVRFLRGHQSQVDLAFQMLKSTSEWRHSKQVEDIIQVFGAEHEQSEKAIKFLKMYYPSSQIGNLEDGSFISLYRMSRVDFRGLLDEFDIEDLVRFNIYKLGSAWTEYPGGNGVLIIDLGQNEGEEKVIDSFWQVGSYISALLEVTKAVSKSVEPHFPESFQKIYFTRPPSLFAKTFAIAKYFVAERTRSKFCVVKDDEMWETFVSHVGKKNLPVWLKGENDLKDFPNGGKLVSEPIAAMLKDLN